MSVQVEPKTSRGDTGSPDDLTHVVDKDKLVEAIIEGHWVEALCGVRFIPQRDPERYPVCQPCQEAREAIQRMRATL